MRWTLARRMVDGEATGADRIFLHRRAQSTPVGFECPP